MKVAWLADAGNQDGSIGGAELTHREFAAAAPGGVEIIPVDPQNLELVAGCDRACVFNTVTYPPETIAALEGRPVVRYWNDMAPHGDPELKAWLAANAVNVFCSPLHRDRFHLHAADAHVIPPALDLERLHAAAGLDVPTLDDTVVSVGAWMNAGKAPHRAAEWAAEHGKQIVFFGPGPFAPDSCQGVLPPEQVPLMLRSFDTFVFLPTALEPFGRAVAEAALVGCEIVTNQLVGARYWLEENPDGLASAAEDFWKLVLA